MVAHVTDSNFYDTISFDTLTISDWYRLYDELYYMAYDTSQLKPPDSIYLWGNSYYTDTIPIGVMSFDYYELIDSALTTPTYFDFDTINNTISDKFPRIGYPYEEKSIFSAAPLVKRTHFANPVFRIDPSFIFKDHFNDDYFKSDIDFKIDFGDGNGWVTFDPTQVSHHQANYTNDGIHYIKTAIHGNPAHPSVVTHTSTSSIYVGSSQNNKSSNAALVLPGLTAGIYYACNQNNLNNGKIVIYLEGFDVLDFLPSQNRSVEKIYVEMIEDDQLVELRNFGYNFVVVDWNNSTIDLRFNALYLMNLIEELKAMIDEPEQFVIVGESMGGLIARFALTFMETSNYMSQNTSEFLVQKNDPNNIDYYNENQMILDNIPNVYKDQFKRHNTRLLITYDSPHQGANIPISIQHATRSALNIISPVLGPVVNWISRGHNLFLDCQAAQQMLALHIDTKVGADYVRHPDKAIFFHQLDQLGAWPQLCKTVANSSGNLAGKGQININTLAQRIPGDRILDFSTSIYGRLFGSKVTLWSADLSCKTNPAYNTLQVFSANAGKFNLGIKVELWNINVQTGNIFNYYSDNATATAAPLCTSPGGYQGSYNLLNGQGQYGTAGPQLSSLWALNFFQAIKTVDPNGCTIFDSHVGLAGISSGHFDISACTDGMFFCFVPTLSSLDYGIAGTLGLYHNIEGDLSAKYSYMNSDVIIGNHDESVINEPNARNLSHLNSHFNPKITNISRNYSDPYQNPPPPENIFEYYTCDPQTPRGFYIRRGLMNLEVGDEQLYLENAELTFSAYYRTQFDIYVNHRNPYYSYPTQPRTKLINFKRFYSKDNPFTISGSGYATFIVDPNNSPITRAIHTPNPGLDIGNPPLDPSDYQMSIQSLGLCCTKYSSQARRSDPQENLENPEINNYLRIYPNPNSGNELVVNFKLEHENKVDAVILNLSGKLIGEFQFTFESNDLETHKFIDISKYNLRPGMYIMKFYTKSHEFTEKLIIFE